MRILYVSRHFNRSGYYILKHIIKKGYNTVGVVLRDEKNPHLNRLTRWLFLLLYRLKCLYYRCDSCKFTKSVLFLARKHKIPIVKTHSIKSDGFFEELKHIDPDIIVLGGGWPELIPVRVIKYPRLGIINTHPSLLPDFRGTSITRWQILRGLETSGVTIHYVDETFDTGQIISQESVEVSLADTPQSLFDRIAHISGPLMSRVLDRIESANSPPPESTGARAEGDYYSKWKWEDDRLHINWNDTFLNIYNFIRANHQESYQYMGPIFSVNGQAYLLREATLADAAGYPESTHIKDSLVTLIRTDRRGWHLYRDGEDHVLIVKKIQKYSKRYYLRWAYCPGTGIGMQLKPGYVFSR